MSKVRLVLVLMIAVATIAIAVAAVIEPILPYLVVMFFLASLIYVLVRGR